MSPNRCSTQCTIMSRMPRAAAGEATLQTYLSRTSSGFGILRASRLLTSLAERAGRTNCRLRPGFPQRCRFLPDWRLVAVAQSRWQLQGNRDQHIRRIVSRPHRGAARGVGSAEHAFAITVAQSRTGLKSLHGHLTKHGCRATSQIMPNRFHLGGYGTCIPADQVARRTPEMKTRDPTRPVTIDFGRSRLVANEFWRGRGACNGDQTYYDAAI